MNNQQIEDQFELMFQLLNMEISREEENPPIKTAVHNGYLCKHCGSDDLIYTTEGRTCLQCTVHDNDFDVIQQAVLEDYHLKSVVPYKRKIYFIRKLRFLYGQQRVVVPLALIMALRTQYIREERSIRKYCRENTIWKSYLRHSRKIFYIVNDIKIRDMPLALQNMLLSMFCRVEEEYVPFWNKKKFMNYNEFIRRALCWIHCNVKTDTLPLEHLQYIPAPKSKSTEVHNNMLWESLDVDNIFFKVYQPKNKQT